jgi:hypothetical protein
MQHGQVNYRQAFRTFIKLNCTSLVSLSVRLFTSKSSWISNISTSATFEVLQLCSWEFHSPASVIDWIPTFQGNVVSSCWRVIGARRKVRIQSPMNAASYPKSTESSISSSVNFVNPTFARMTFVTGMISGIRSWGIDIESVRIFCSTVVSTHLLFSLTSLFFPQSLWPELCTCAQFPLVQLTA